MPARLRVAVGLFWMAMLLGSTALTAADQATYIYDDLGRLSEVMDGHGEVATYTYDAVGNLLSNTRNTGGLGAPTIDAVTSNHGRTGAIVTVSLTGTHLTGAAIMTDNSGILVRDVLTTPTAVSASLVLPFSARPGAMAVTLDCAGDQYTGAVSEIPVHRPMNVSFWSTVLVLPVRGDTMKEAFLTAGIVLALVALALLEQFVMPYFRH